MGYKRSTKHEELETSLSPNEWP